MRGVVEGRPDHPAPLFRAGNLTIAAESEIKSVELLQGIGKLEGKLGDVVIETSKHLVAIV